MQTWDALLNIAGFLFPFWPVFLFSALVGKRRGFHWGQALFAWGVLALTRGFLLFHPEAQGNMQALARLYLPDPWNTLLFLLTGFVLGSVWFFLRYRPWLTWYWERKVYGMTQEDLLKLSPRQFEELVAALFRAFGYKVRLKGRQGDHGVDLLVLASDGRKAVVQCKRWRKPVGEPVVRDLYGTMYHEKADRAFLFAVGGFTDQAREWAQGKPISLYDGADLLRLWRQAQRARRRRRRSSVPSKR